MLTKLQTKIQERVDAEITSVTPRLEWEIIKSKVFIEHSLEKPCFKVYFSPVNVDKPADNAAKTKRDGWVKWDAVRRDAKSYVHAIIFNLTNFSKDTFELVNDKGAGLVLEKIDPIDRPDYGGFAITMEANNLTKDVFEDLSATN